MDMSQPENRMELFHFIFFDSKSIVEVCKACYTLPAHVKPAQLYLTVSTAVVPSYEGKTYCRLKCLKKLKL